MSDPRKPGLSKPDSQNRAPRQPDTPRPAIAKPPGATPISRARRAAFEVLMAVAATDGHSDDLLHGRALRNLSQADRNLATALVLGTLRWQIALDARLRPLLTRPDARLAPPVEIALRLGAFQLLHMDRIPAHAALNESVELCRAANEPHAAGMVNAVLRKLSTAPPAGKKLLETVPIFAERLGHPAWLVERWARHYGRAAAQAICEFDQTQPASTATQDSASETDPQPGAPPTDTAPQPLDPGSRLVAELAAAAAPHARRIWDTCAAPGGKTLVLASRHPEAQVLATDISPARLRRLAERLQREAPGQPIKAELADAAKLPDSHGPFDLILCDAPCSGTGTLARNPEIRHRLQPADLSRQARRQKDILKAAFAHLAPGGRLVYSTCSLEPEENEQVVASMLAVTGVRRVRVEALLEELHQRRMLPAEDAKPLAKDGNLRTVPGANFQGDGFFAAVFQRAN